METRENLMDGSALSAVKLHPLRLQTNNPSIDRRDGNREPFLSSSVE